MSLPFYRTTWTRFTFIATGAYLAVALSPWGPDQWKNTPSLRWLHLVMPWTLLAVLFAGYVLLLLWGRVEAVAVASAVGAVLYGWELVALIATLHVHRPTNPLSIAAVFLACVFHLAAARLAIIQAARRDR